ncbi:hypothetical protein A4G31_26890 [Mycobacterium persicum]|nr:hypothetical protein A4G31_26890 [Mycobacterium persicum]
MISGVSSSPSGSLPCVPPTCLPFRAITPMVYRRPNAFLASAAAALALTVRSSGFISNSAGSYPGLRWMSTHGANSGARASSSQ